MSDEVRVDIRGPGTLEQVCRSNKYRKCYRINTLSGHICVVSVSVCSVFVKVFESEFTRVTVFKF